MYNSYRIRLCQDEKVSVKNNGAHLADVLFVFHLQFTHMVRLSGDMTSNFLHDFFRLKFLFRRDTVLHNRARLSTIFESTGMSSEEINTVVNYTSNYVLQLPCYQNNIERKVFAVNIRLLRETTVDDEDLDQGMRLTPTSDEAIEKLERIQIDRGLELGKEKCMVCFDEFLSNDRSEFALKLPCGHCYHEKCIVKWLQNRNTCPLCRYEMPCSSDN